MSDDEKQPILKEYDKTYDGKSSKKEQSDKDFDGPVSKRSCRDVICLIIFLAFWGGMGYIAYVAIRDGQPERLIFGADSYGNVCGSKNKPIDNVTLSGMDMRDRPFLFYFDVSAIVDPTTESKMLCVKKCPEGVIFQSLEDYAIETNITLCDYDVDVEDYGSASTGPVAQCPEWPITNQTVILNRCFPLNFLESVTDTFSTIFNADLLRKIFSDIEKSWHEILYLCAISVGLAVVITIIMRFFAAVIIYITVFVFIIGSLGGTAYLWYLWYSSKTELDNMSTELRMDEDEDNVKTLLIYAGVASGVTLILLLILLVMRKRISLVVTLFKEAGKAIASMPFLLIQPVWTFLFVAVLCVYWLFIYLYIATAGQAQLHKDSGFVEYVEDEAVKYFFWYHLFGLLWGAAFLWACQEMTIAGAVATWFFTRNKKKLPSSPIFTSIGRLLRYHLGSVALGSFLIALVQMARIVLGYIQSKLHGAQNEFLKFLLKCLQCCLWCFEKFLKFINRNAYIEIAIYGDNFCKSAQKAFKVIISNVLRLAAINSVGDFCLFLGKLAVVAVTAVIGIEVFFKNMDDVHYKAIPIALACVFAYIISHTFLSVYEMTIDTIFVCFSEDCDMNDGVTKPYFMSKDLMSYTDNASEATNTEMIDKKTKK